MRINCKYLVKEDNGCGINKGWGWRREYCGIAHLGKDCDHIVPMDELITLVKHSKTAQHRELMRRGRREFNKR